MTSISDFCDQHRACREGREWAIANCTDMADVWRKLKPWWLIWVATRPGVLGDCELRSYILFCVQQVEHLAIDRCNARAIETAEKFARGELASGGSAAAYAAEAAGAAAHTAFCNADAGSDADGVAAKRAIVAAQAEWLRANTRPNFGVEWKSITRGGHHVRNVVRGQLGWRGEVCLRPGGPRRGEPEDWQVEVWKSDGTYYGGSPKSELDLVAITEWEQS